MSAIDHIARDVTRSRRSSRRARRPRATLRAQIARIERELAAPGGRDLSAPAADRAAGRRPRPARARPRRARARPRRPRRASGHPARARRADQAARQADARALLERMLPRSARPQRVRLVNADLGAARLHRLRRSSRALGLVGMLAGWWHVKISSGCPLAWGP